MKELFESFFGNKATKAKKITSFACVATALVLIVALVVLIVSSALLSARDKNKEDEKNNKPTIEYTTVEQIDANSIFSNGELVNVRDNRSELNGENNFYYATLGNEVKVCANVQKALDRMLVAFYNSNRDKIVANTKDANCNIPLISDVSANGTAFVIKSYDDNITVSGNSTFAWLFTNAHKYGFIYSGNKFTHVGVVHATYMSRNSLADMSAYVSALKNGPVTVSVTNAIDGTSGEFYVYHLASGAELSVPSNYKYVAMNDGNGGYIISVDMSKSKA